MQEIKVGTVWVEDGMYFRVTGVHESFNEVSTDPSVYDNLLNLVTKIKSGKVVKI